MIPYVLVAPYYFAGQIPLGVMTQTAGAFARVEGAMSFFITFYVTLADYKAQVDRLTTFDAAMNRADAMAAASALSVVPATDRGLHLKGLALDLPDGRRIAEALPSRSGPARRRCSPAPRARASRRCFAPSRASGRSARAR